MKKIIAIILFGFSLFACTFIRGPKPSLSLVDAQLTEVTLLETTLLLTVRIENEGPHLLRIRGATHRVYLNDIDVGKGTSDQNLEIKEFGTELQKVTVHLSNLSLASKIQSLIEARDFDYRIESTLYSEAGLFDQGVKISNAGRFSVASSRKR